ncbi:MAG TPA: class I SAM-dependent methyltransferase [Methylophilaceae bacterium]|jgi:predicted O-methyltransferase YrrM
MLAIIKQAAKAILPTPFLNRCVNTVGQLQLQRVPTKRFDAGNLRSLASPEFSHIFHDPVVIAAWEEDDAAIADLFGGGDYSGGLNPGDRRALYFLIMALKPRNVLEVGTHIGASTIYIAAALKRLNQGAKLTTVDITDVNHPEQGAWKKVGMSKSPASFAAEFGLLDRIQFHTGPSLEFMRVTDQQFDFIFLDGDHAARTVYEELCLALPLLRKGSLILLHDYYPDAKPLYPHSATIGGPFHALRRIHKENPLIEVLPLGELPWPTKQGMNVTSLALVVKSCTTAV